LFPALGDLKPAAPINYRNRSVKLPLATGLPAYLRLSVSTISEPNRTNYRLNMITGFSPTTKNITVISKLGIQAKHYNNINAVYKEE